MSSFHYHLFRPIIVLLRWLHKVLAQCWRACQRIGFPKKLCFRFSWSLRAIRRWWARFGLSFAVANIKKIIFGIKLRLHEGRRLPAIIWLCLWFSSIFFGEISQNFHILWKLSCRSFKNRKKGFQRHFTCFLQFCVFFLNLKFGLMNFFYQQALGRTNMFNGPANLGSKDPYFLCRKTLRNGIEIRQDRYLSLRRLSNLSPFGSLSHGVFFSVDLFFRRDGLWILRVQLLEIQDSITYKLYCVQLFLTHLFG